MNEPLVSANPIKDVYIFDGFVFFASKRAEKRFKDWDLDALVAMCVCTPLSVAISAALYS